MARLQPSGNRSSGWWRRWVVEVEDRGKNQILYRAISTRAQTGSPSVSQEGQTPSPGTQKQGWTLGPAESKCPTPKPSSGSGFKRVSGHRDRTPARGAWMRPTGLSIRRSGIDTALTLCATKGGSPETGAVRHASRIFVSQRQTSHRAAMPCNAIARWSD